MLTRFVSLELQILFINFFGLVSSIFNWSWLKWDRQLEKISNFSVSQFDELEVEDIDGLKTILSWIEVARLVIDRVSFFAYAANIYTIFIRSRQNLLVLWMVLSFLRDIVLEVVVIVIAFLQWYKGFTSTWRLFKFFGNKTINLVISICTWCPTLKWYMQLRSAAKFRRFTIIARRSIASIVNVPGRVGRSLDDECLGIAIIRRGKYASVSNLDRFSVESSSRANSKSLTLITDDTSDAYNFDYNSDLSVAEKSMRLLNVTAEDVMDARARIQERAYWDERDVIAETPKVIEKVAQFPLENNEKRTIDASRNKPAKEGLEKTVVLKKKDITGNPTMKEEAKEDEEKGKDKIVLINGKEQVLTGNQENISLIKSEKVIFDKVNGAKSTDSCDIFVAPKNKRKKEGKGVAKIVQCPSFESKSARDMEAKPCASLVKKLETKPYLVSGNQQEKRDNLVGRRKHPSYQIDTQLMPTSDESKKERYKNSTMCACRRALRNSSKNGRHARSIDVDGKNVEYDISGKEFRSFTPVVNMQQSRVDKSAFRYSEAYRLKKRIQKWEESRKKQSWGSESLAQTARPSGYERNVIDASDKLSIGNSYRKSVQIGACDESTKMSDSLSERLRLTREQMRNKRSGDLRSVYNMVSSREENYPKVRETELKALETHNNFLLKNKRETKARNRHDLLPANRKLSIEQRDAIQLRALRACNELTLSEDKRELEARRDSPLNYGRSTKESEEMKVLKTYNDPILPEDRTKIERTRGRNLSPSSQQSVNERSESRVHNKVAQSESERELQTRRKRDSLRDEAPECEDVETPASVSNRLSIGSYEDTAISTSQNANSNSGLNDRYARQAHMSLNLREITRNIEWIAHPRGVILANKNLHGQFLENGRFRESQQRDIIDDNTVSMLHSAFFFKPEIVTRIFGRAHDQTRIDEFFPSFPILRREEFDTEFNCRMNNEMIIYNRDSLFDYDLERRMRNDQNYLGDSMLPNASDNRGNNLYVIFIDQERVLSESETATINSTTTESWEDARLSIEGTRTTNILVADENVHNRVDSVTNNIHNLPVRLFVGIRNFDIEMSEESIRDVALPIEYVSNVNEHHGPQHREFNTDAVNSEKENNSESERISLHKNADDDETVHEIERTLNSSDNCAANVNVTSYVDSLEKLDKSRDKKYLSNICSENEIFENNLLHKSTDDDTTLQLLDNNNSKQLDTFNNKTEESMFNHVFKKSSKLSLPGPSSLHELDNYHALRSCDEKLQKLTQLSNSAATLNDHKQSVSNVKATNHDTLSQLGTLKLENMVQDGARSGINVYEEANELLAEKFFKMHSDDELQQDDSFYFTYKRNDDPGTPVSMGNGSLMEEFLNDPIPPLNTS